MLPRAAAAEEREEEEGSRRHPKRRCTTGKKSYVAPGTRGTHGPSSGGPGADRWQKWPKEQLRAAEEIATAAATAKRTSIPQQDESRSDERQQRKKRRREAVAEAAAAAAATKRQQTAEERRTELEQWIGANRNANTQAAYTSGWNQFVEWTTTIENPQRAAASQVSLERPTETDVAQYCRFIVQTKGCTMSSVQGALAAIADHLRFKVTRDYNPCQRPLVRQTCDVLKPRATPAQQKKEMSAKQLQEIMHRARAAGSKTTMRDACIIQLAYHTLLRSSEIVRMKRGDISFAQEMVAGRSQRVMKVHVNRLSKNDSERKGHERLVLEEPQANSDGATGAGSGGHCLVRHMEMHLVITESKLSTSGSPLFETLTGGAMSQETPRHRLHYWLNQIGVADPSEYGFHSLRAGGASEAARAGVHEREIKLHGNWKSDAVRVYIRPQIEERLAVSAAMSAAAAR